MYGIRWRNADELFRSLCKPERVEAFIRHKILSILDGNIKNHLIANFNTISSLSF